MKSVDKTIRHNYIGRSYTVKISAKENCAYIFDDAYSEPVFKMSPVNNLTMIEIGVLARKGARYLSGLERDYEKLKSQGFEFLGPIKPAIPAKPAPAPGKRKKEVPASSNLPMWMRKND